MLKSNSTKAHNNIKNYILKYQNVIEYADYYNIIIDDENIKEVSSFILAVFYNEYLAHNNRMKNRSIMNCVNVFTDYAAGLPSVLDTCYFYNRSAADDIAIILEETEEEKQKYINKYDESQCENKLSYMIYNQLIKNYDYTLFNQYLKALQSK